MSFFVSRDPASTVKSKLHATPPVAGCRLQVQALPLESVRKDVVASEAGLEVDYRESVVAARMQLRVRTRADTRSSCRERQPATRGFAVLSVFWFPRVSSDSVTSTSPSSVDAVAGSREAAREAAQPRNQAISGDLSRVSPCSQSQKSTCDSLLRFPLDFLAPSCVRVSPASFGAEREQITGHF